MKQATNTLIYINMGSEMIFILNNRIKALDIDEGKRLSILAQIAQKLYNSEETDKLIRDCTSTLTLDMPFLSFVIPSILSELPLV